MTLEMGAEVTPKRQRLSRKKRRIYGAANQEIRQGKLAPQILADAEKTFEKRQRPARKVRTETSDGAAGALPHYSIGRPINRHVPEAADWRSFLGNLEDVNQGRGEVFALRGVAIEYINDASIKAMLAAKYSRVYGERERAVRLLRDFSRDFNRYAKEQVRTHDDAVFEVATGPLRPAERMMQSGDDLYLLPDMYVAACSAEGEYDDFEDDFSCYGGFNEVVMNWGHGVFKTDTIVNCGRLGMAVTIEYRAELDSEFSDITTYLRREGLNTKLLVSPYDDYVFSFEQRAPIYTRQDSSTTMLTGMDIPTVLPLHPPAAREISTFIGPQI